MKNFIRLLASYALAMLTMSIFVGCSENVESVDVGPPYLSISSEKSLSEFTPEEWDILNEARSRIDITINSDKLMVIAQQSGSEVNISEHLFQKIKLLVDNGNRIISEVCHTTTRLDGDDCVARCIVNVADCYGGDLSLSEVTEEIEERCGDGGVPPNRVLEMVNIWLVCEDIPNLPISTAALEPGCQIIAVILDRHAIWFKSVNGNNIYIYDDALVREDSNDPENGYAQIPGAYVSQAINVMGLK